MLSLIFGIVLLVVSVFFIGVAARAYPPGTYRPRYLHPTTVGDLLTAIGLSAAALAGGLFLLLR